MKFKYTAKTTQGQAKSGLIEAANLQVASEVLRKENFFITSLKEEKETTTINIIAKLLKRVSLRDKVVFTQQLAVMIQSGLPLIPALRTIQSQTQNKNYAITISQVADDVEGGTTLSAALAKHEDIFPKIYSQVVKSGEKSGELDKVLLKLSSDMSKNYDLVAKIRGALIYPTFILVALIVVAVVILIFVIPQLATIFAEANVRLPITTRSLIALSKFVKNFWWLIIILIIGFTFLYQWLCRQIWARRTIDSFKLKIPIFGALQRKMYLATFTRTLATLTAAGLPILETFQTLQDSINNIHYQEDIKSASQKIEGGMPVGAALKQTKNFPPMLYEMITVGERSGNLDFILSNLATFLEKDVSYMAKNMTALLEPVLMIIMGAGVAFIITTVLLPIYNLVQVIK